MSPILVIGATGTVGRHIVTELALSGRPVRAMARRPNRVCFPRIVEAVSGDLTNPEDLERSFRGVQCVFLIWASPSTEKIEPVLERIANYARRVVFLSAPLKSPHPFFQQPNPTQVLASRIEIWIEQSGMEWTFLRPGMFAGNARHFWGSQIRAGHVVRWPYLAVHTAPIDERDIAAVAVRTLTEDNHVGSEYVLTGPQSLSQREQIAILGKAIGRMLQIEEISPEDARREWTGMPSATAEMLLRAWSATTGRPAYVTNTFQEIMGIPPHTFFEWATDHAAEFQNETPSRSEAAITRDP